MVRKVVKDDLSILVDTEIGEDVTLVLEEVEATALVRNVSFGSALFNNYFERENLDFILQHTALGLAVQGDIDVFELVKKALKGTIKVQLEYTGYDLLQEATKQSIEICRVTSKITNKEYSLKCEVTTKIPVYPLGWLSEYFISGYDSATDTLADFPAAYKFPYMVQGGVARRTTQVHTQLEPIELANWGDVFIGYYPQYNFQGILCTPIRDCFSFMVGRVRNNDSKCSPMRNLGLHV